MILIRPSGDPFTCEELALRGLLSTSPCCVLCHSRGRHGSGELTSLVVTTEAGHDLDAEVCCTAARTLTAHRALSA